MQEVNEINSVIIIGGIPPSDNCWAPIIHEVINAVANINLSLFALLLGTTAVKHVSAILKAAPNKNAPTTMPIKPKSASRKPYALIA